MGNTWSQHMRKKQSRKEGKPCGHCSGRSVGTPECYSWTGPTYLSQGLGLPVRKVLLWTMCSTSLLSWAQIIQGATFCHQIQEAPIYTFTAWKSAWEKAAKVTGKYCVCLLQTSPPPSSKISGRETKLPEPGLVLQILVNFILMKTTHFRGIHLITSSRAQQLVQSHLFRFGMPTGNLKLAQEDFFPLCFNHTVWGSRSLCGHLSECMFYYYLPCFLHLKAFLSTAAVLSVVTRKAPMVMQGAAG